MCIIFGKDCAAGQDAQGPEDIEDEVNTEDDEAVKNDAPESSSTQDPSERVETSSVRSESELEYLRTWLKVYQKLPLSLVESLSLIHI